MYKRIISLFLSLIAVILFVSCGTPQGSTDKKLYQKFDVDYSGSRNAKYYSTQLEKTAISYYWDEKSFFNVTQNNDKIDEGDVQIGWNGLSSGFGYVNYYYSDTDKNPLFVYNPRLREVFLRSDYDYKSDTFMLEGTYSKIIFSDAVTENELDRSTATRYNHGTWINLQSETHSRLRIHVNILSIADKWYIQTQSGYTFEITDDFLNLLVKNQIIAGK